LLPTPPAPKDPQQQAGGQCGSQQWRAIHRRHSSTAGAKSKARRRDAAHVFSRALWRTTHVQSGAVRPTIARMQGRPGKKIITGAWCALMLAFTGAVDAAAVTQARSGPELKSASALVTDANNGEVLFERDATRV